MADTLKAIDSTLYDVIRRPVMTEKNSLLMESGKYTFEVARTATKSQIKRAVELAFEDVTVRSVNIISVHAKRRNFSHKRKRISDWGPRWKKAIVTLNPGQSIAIFEEV
ncbi:MAG TPA: 50S ribosomal protein L23 [Chloroflexia bacterium]|nr:50S ribosomal protein L23 [Chloroflexia bacterium]